MITLILGGARSGKSSIAEKLALKRGGEAVLYVATLEPYDDAEMRERIVHHKATRPAIWSTLEAPYDLSQKTLASLTNEKIVLLDCLTVWVSNKILQASNGSHALIEPDGNDLIIGDAPELEIEPALLERQIITELEQLIVGLKQRGIGLIMVSNEVGMGLVPPYPLGRVYRDLLGRVNQAIAQNLADEVFMILAGIPIELKRLQAILE